MNQYDTEKEEAFLNLISDPLIAITPDGRVISNKASVVLGLPCITNGISCGGDICTLSRSGCILRGNEEPSSRSDTDFTHAKSNGRFRIVRNHSDDGYGLIHFKPATPVPRVTGAPGMKEDTITGLPHMDLLFEALQLEIIRARKSEEYLGVFFLDLVRFGTINTTLGRVIGDQILKTISIRFKKILRGADMVARQGSDVFVVIAAPGQGGKKGLLTLAQRLIKCVSDPIAVGDTTIKVTCSIGISVFPADGDDFQSLLKTADIALHNAKKAGRNEVRMYSVEMDKTAGESLELEHRLHDALKAREFLLHYQPQVNINGKIIGAEALIRWDMPNRGMIPPLKFIPLAEESGAIIEIGAWVIDEACAQIRQWIDKEKINMPVAVNVSVRQFRDKSLVSTIVDSLKRHNIPAHMLCVEITEAVAIDDPILAIKTMHEIADMGVVLAIDDFGTGYSSLNYLKKFPVKKLKIDRSFVQNITVEKGDASICKSIIDLAHNFGIQVVAEGAEKLEHMDFLRNLQCDEVQGFYISKPLSASGFIDLVRTSRLFVE
jgi:diguanylate cyclase (GGDEF)-like protein